MRQDADRPVLRVRPAPGDPAGSAGLLLFHVDNGAAKDGKWVTSERTDGGRVANEAAARLLVILRLANATVVRDQAWR